MKLKHKFCSCIVKVRGKKTKKIKNPYGICINSIYKKRGLKKPKFSCLKILNLNKLTKKQLIDYAIEKKIKYTNLTKKKLIYKLKNYKKLKQRIKT